MPGFCLVASCLFSWDIAPRAHNPPIPVTTFTVGLNHHYGVVGPKKAFKNLNVVQLAVTIIGVVA
jgi:hypothetical protein